MNSIRPTTNSLIRKLVVYRETVMAESHAAIAQPVHRAAAVAVITNPWFGLPAGAPLIPDVVDFVPALAIQLVDRLAEALGGAAEVDAFGKGAIVGTGGELEHGAAIIHTPYFGNTIRDELEGESIICFADARGDAGSALSVPMWHKVRASTRSHYQTLTVRVPDAPRADEIVVIATASTGPRPYPRIGDRLTDPSAEDVRATTTKVAEALNLASPKG